MFLIGYGGFRFLAEFAREPDQFLGVLSLGLSMGQWLSIPMILLGLVIIRIAHRRVRVD
jgi:phosphatidylglycerol:prolipoprotein diacylglycerol transferase